MSAAVRSGDAAARHIRVLPSTALAILFGLCVTPANAAQWYTVNSTKGECERASRTDYPTPDDFVDYLQKQNQYRSRQVSRDFTGRAEVVTVTDINNRQMIFYVDDEACQQALRRQLRIGGHGQAR